MMDGPDVSLRYFREGDEEGILDCLNAAFGRWPSVDLGVPPIDHLRWKMQSDEIAPRFQYVAEAGSQIVGCELMVVQRIKSRDRILLAGSGADLAVHPDFRGRGMMKELWTLISEDFEQAFNVLWAASGNPIVLRESVKWRYRPLSNGIDVLECPLPFPPAATRERGDWVIRGASGFDERIDAFWEEASRPFEFIVVRTKEYLNWRYGDPRAGLFAIRFAEQDGRVLGYSVLRTSRGRGHIADLLALPERDDVVRSLVGDALEHFRGANVPSVRCWSPSHHPYREILLEHGFHPKRQLEGLVFGQYGGEDLGFLASPRLAVHLMVGDTDIV